MDLRFKLAMFISSFLPLWISIVISLLWELFPDAKILFFVGYEEAIAIWKNMQFPYFSVLIVSMMSLFSIREISNFLKEERQDTRAKISNVRRANHLSSEFLLSYVLPLVAFDFTVLKDLVIFALYFVTLAFICIRNNNFYVNIFMELKGYQLFYGDISLKKVGKKWNYTESLFISKLNLSEKSDSYIKYYSISNYIYLVKEEVTNE